MKSYEQNWNKTAALYVRDAQANTSIKTQQDFLAAWAKAEDLTVHRVYSDAGYSGITENRPDLQEMLRDAEAGHFQVVAVKTLDRLTRDVHLLLNTMKDLDQKGVAVIAVENVRKYPKPWLCFFG